MLLKSLYQQLCASLKAKPQCSTSMYLHIIKQKPKKPEKNQQSARQCSK